MNETLQALMRQATQMTQSGRLNEATQAIQRALRGDAATPSTPRAPEPKGAEDAHLVLDGCVFEVDAPTGTGEFTSGTHTHATLTRRFKLYTPPGQTGRALPLVVMLHGCTQNPDDFAAGTGMNERAREQGFCVLYPEQSQDANPSRCWNWFKHNHQKRGSGEPALLASMTQMVVQKHGLDARRVFIAGLSAGGAMAAIVAEAYPDIFAAVGVHSGLPSGSANNVAEAMMVMKSGEAGIHMPTKGHHFGAAGAATAQTKTQSQPKVPTIVFHGDHDQTVHPRNGEKVIAAAVGHANPPRMEQGISARGRRYTRAIHHNEQGKVMAEHWVVHGAGHAWSGGDAKGSYTDAQGPDATQEMLRFFLG
jgi:poly(hydroxyalkanoate) depolymerase family esterase